MSNPIVTMTGRIGTEPEMINYSGGKGIKFRMVTSDRVKNKAGDWEDKDTSWWNIYGRQIWVENFKRTSTSVLPLGITHLESLIVFLVQSLQGQLLQD
jgi:single-stranded DNA-binding protein